MGAIPSVAARTAIELGPENRDANNDTVIRSAGLRSIPIYNAFNPVQPRNQRTALNRAKTGLGSDGFALGASSYAIQGEFFIYGSGIANLPPPYFELMRAFGFKEMRLASIAASAATPTASETATGGLMDRGGYAYGYTVLFEADGTTPAPTLLLAAFESKMSAPFKDATPVTGAGAATVSVTLGALPSAGIKRIYRTKAADAANTDPAAFQFVGIVPDGNPGSGFLSADVAAATGIDGLNDVNRGERATLSRSAPTTPSAADQDAVAGNLATTTAYHYKATVLYDFNGAPAASADVAQFESEPSADFTATTDAATDAISITSLPSAGVKRIYRADAGTTNNYKFVGTVADGTTSTIEGLAEGSRGAALVDGVDCAIYVPVSEYLDFDALTVLSYLDSRKYPAKSCRGGFDANADAGENMLVRFNLEGAYTASTKVNNPTLASNPGAPPQFCSAGLIMAPEGQIERTDVRVLNVGVSVPRTPGARRNANASCDNAGITEYQVNQPVDPRLTLLLEAPKEIGQVEDTDWVADDRNSLYFGFEFTVGTVARKRVKFTNDAPWGERRYLAQIAEDVTFDTDQPTGNRSMRVNLQLTERTGIGGSFVRMIHF